MALSNESLSLILEQVDQKHDAAHKRLRSDLTDGMNDLNGIMEQHRKQYTIDHDTLVRLDSTRERQKDLNGYKAIIVAAAIGGGFRLLEVLINATVVLMKGRS